MRVTVAGRSIYCYTGTRPFAAAQPSVVFVHGAANDHGVWALQSRYWAHHGRNALAPDLPGHGRSEGDALASVEAIADFLAQFLDALGVGTAVFVGHSLGALAVLECAGRHRGRCERVVLLGPAVPMVVSDALLDAARANDHAAFELINGWSFSPAKQLGGNRQPGVWLTGNAMRLMERSAPGVLHTDLLACHRYEGGFAAAAGAQCPALLVLGQRDIMAPPKNAQALVQALRDPRVVTLPGCGHSMMSEEPDAVLDALRGFLG